MKRLVMFLFIFSYIPNALFAGYTLEELREKALRSNNAIMRKELELKDAQYMIMEAIGSATPEIRAEIAYAYLYDSIMKFELPEEIPLAEPIDMPAPLPDITSIQTNGMELEYDIGNHQLPLKIVFEQPLFTGGRIVNAIIMSKKNKSLVMEEIKSEKLKLVYEIDEYYYLYLLLKKKKELTESYYDAANEYYNAALKSYEAGLATEFSLLDVKAKIKKVKASQLEVNNALEGVLEYIQFLCNDPYIDEIDGELHPVEDTISEKKDVKLGLLMRPDLKALYIKQSLAKLNIANGIGTMPIIPEIGMQVELSYTNTNKDNWQNYSTNVQIGIMGTIKIYDKLTTTTALMKKINSLKKVNLGLDELQRGIEMEIKAAIRDYENSEELVAYWNEEVEKVKKDLYEAKVKLDNGVITKTDYLSKKVELEETEVSYYEAIYNMRIAYSKLNKAIGDFDIK